jgi:hypothetical protein
MNAACSGLSQELCGNTQLPGVDQNSQMSDACQRDETGNVCKYKFDYEWDIMNDCDSRDLNSCQTSNYCFTQQ